MNPWLGRERLLTRTRRSFPPQRSPGQGENPPKDSRIEPLTSHRKRPLTPALSRWEGERENRRQSICEGRFHGKGIRSSGSGSQDQICSPAGNKFGTVARNDEVVVQAGSNHHS